MFFKIIQEFKEANPRIGANVSLDVLKPFINQVEAEILISVLSQAQYDGLHTKYQNTSLSADESTLVNKIQLALAPLTISAAAPELNMVISDLGMHMHSSENSKQPFQWMIRDFQKSRERVGYAALEQMLLYLESKKGVFTDWAGSTAYTEFKDCYLSTAIDFYNKGRVNIRNHRLTFLALKPFMKDVEETHIIPVIGLDYHTELMDQIKAGTSLDADDTKAVNLIQQAIAHLTIAEAMPLLGIEISSIGYMVTTLKTNTDNDTERNSETSERLDRVIEFEKQKGNGRLKELRDLLYSSSSSYPTFTADETVYVTPPTDGSVSTQFPNKPTNTFYFGG